MTVNNATNNQYICPFLGILSDERTAMAYPSAQNYCHHVHPAITPAAVYQRKYCLDAANTTCPVFTAAKGTPMPEEMTAEKPSRLPLQKTTHFWILLIIELAVGAVGIWALINLSRNQPPADPLAGTLGSVTPVSALPSTTISPTPTFSPTSTPTSLPPTPTLTLAPQPLHLLEVPFGTKSQFLMHRVAQAESMLSLAATYGTTPEAIRAVNFDLGPTLWANDVLVIPLGQTDLTGILPMSPYNITSDGVTVESLAAEQGVDAAQLCDLNALPLGYQFTLDEWVLIPHSNPAP